MNIVKNTYNNVLYKWVGPNGFSAKRHTLPPKSLHIPISVYVVKHVCYLELWEGQGESRKWGRF